MSDKFNDYAEVVRRKLADREIRVSCDLRNEKIGAKIREGRHALVPYLAVVGAREEESGSVGLRSRKEGELGETPVDTLLARVLEEIKNRRL